MFVETASSEPVHGALHLARQEAADAVMEAASEGQGANWAAPPLSSPLAPAIEGASERRVGPAAGSENCQ